MRRSLSVKMTLLPVLATAAVASAAAPGDTPPVGEQGDIPPPDPERDFSPQEMQLAPPGMTPTIDQIDCDDPELPYWEYRLRGGGMKDDQGEAGGGGGGVGRAL